MMAKVRHLCSHVLELGSKGWSPSKLCRHRASTRACAYTADVDGALSMVLSS